MIEERTIKVTEDYIIKASALNDAELIELIRTKEKVARSIEAAAKAIEAEAERIRKAIPDFREIEALRQELWKR